MHADSTNCAVIGLALAVAYRPRLLTYPLGMANITATRQSEVLHAPVTVKGIRDTSMTSQRHPKW